MTAQPKSGDLAERIDWWSKARFGLFIHWGLYAIPAGEWDGEPIESVSEWIMLNGQIQVRDYEPLAEQFNPTGFDAKAWVRLMKDAGCRYFVITTKHHDGFALYRSEKSDYTIAATPFGQDNGRDIMRELADAAREEGIRIGWYHSIMDWHHEDYLPRYEWDDRSKADADFDRYVKYLHAQVEEILTRYGEVDVIWFDGEWESSWTHEHGVALYEHCRKLSPNIIVNNRVDKGRDGMAGMNKKGDYAGDFGTPEQEVPDEGFGPGVYWESCMTMNDSWGFKARDENWKSSTRLIRDLVDTASKGGNYLLNVGPDARGVIPSASVERLQDIGRWLKVNGESIYGTQASIIGKPGWGRSTTRLLENGRAEVYLHIFNWPEDGRLLVDLEGYEAIGADRDIEVQSAGSSGGAVVVTLGDGPWDKHASVVKLAVSVR